MQRRMVVMLVMDALQSVFMNTTYWKEFTHENHLLFTDTVFDLRKVKVGQYCTVGHET